MAKMCHRQISQRILCQTAKLSQKRESFKPEKPLLKIFQIARLCRKPKQFQTTINQFLVKPAQRFKERLQLAIT